MTQASGFSCLSLRFLTCQVEIVTSTPVCLRRYCVSSRRSVKNQCRDDHAPAGLSQPLSCLSRSPTPASMVGPAWSPGMTSAAPALPTPPGPRVPSSCGVLASPASRLPPVRRSLVASSVSVCPGRPTCWVLDTPARFDPAPNLGAHHGPGCQQFQPRVAGPLHPAGQAFWRKKAFVIDFQGQIKL